MKNKSDRKRKLKKVRRKRSLRALFAVIGLISLLLLVQFIVDSSIFSVSRISVKGTDILKKEEVIKKGGITTGSNLFDVDTNKIEAKLQEDPWVEEVTVTKSLPDRITVQIKERKPFVQLKKGRSFFLLDRKGFVVRKEKENPGLTLIEAEYGLVTRVRHGIKDKNLRSALSIVDKINGSTSEKVKWLRISEEKEIKLLLRRNVEVIYGFAQENEDKILAISSVLKKADEKRETLFILDVRVPSFPTSRKVSKS